MTIQKNDFVELEFTGRIENTGEIFDTTKEKDAKNANLPEKNLKPLIISIGHAMLPKGFDTALEGNEEKKEYTITLTPEEAFGERDKKLVQMVPTKLFHEQKINPVRGMQLSLEGRLVRILSSDRGRTLVDFNGPLAGKKVSYNYKILRKIEDEKEKINALQDFLFRRRYEYENNNGKIVFNVEKGHEGIIQMFKEKFKEILDKEIEAKIVEKKEETNIEKKEGKETNTEEKEIEQTNTEK